MEKGETGAISLRKPNLVHRVAGGPGVRNLSHGVYSRNRAAAPPAYRENESDLKPHNPVQHLRRELVRRVARGREGWELWQDGTLLFFGRNDENFLGWTVRPKALENNIYINNCVLTGVVYIFLTATIQIFSGMLDPPRKDQSLFRIDERGHLCS